MTGSGARLYGEGRSCSDSAKLWPKTGEARLVIEVQKWNLWDSVIDGQNRKSIGDKGPMLQRGTFYFSPMTSIALQPDGQCQDLMANPAHIFHLWQVQPQTCHRAYADSPPQVHEVLFPWQPTLIETGSLAPVWISCAPFLFILQCWSMRPKIASSG